MTDIKLEGLNTPFTSDQISKRAQSVTKDGSKALALSYIDARDVMKRLDDVCGQAGWKDAYETHGSTTVCIISIKIDGEWVSKSDGAGDTDVEAEKGAMSDAFKRAAVKWGVGRHLYDMEAKWLPCECFKDQDGKLQFNNKGKPRFKKWLVNQSQPPKQEPPKQHAQPDPKKERQRSLYGELKNLGTTQGLTSFWDDNVDEIASFPEDIQGHFKTETDKKETALNGDHPFTEAAE